MHRNLGSLLSAAFTWYVWGWGAFAVRALLGICLSAAGGLLIWAGAANESGWASFWVASAGVPIALAGIYFWLPGAAFLWLWISDQLR